jgi:hypothetical protein
MDSILNKILDRIYRMNRIISRFPEETVKTTIAWRRTVNHHKSDEMETVVFRYFG